MPSPDIYDDATALGEREILVPEFLLDHQNILNQPPFHWIMLDDGCIPDDFFQKDEGPTQLLYALAKGGDTVYRWTTEEIYAHKSTPLFALVSYEYRDLENSSLLYVLNRVSTHLQQEYPHSLDYLFRYWIERREFMANGEPSTNKTSAIPSYCAFAVHQVYLTKQRGLAGITHILPTTYAMEVDVLGNLPPTKPANRYYRLIHSGALE